MAFLGLRFADCHESADADSRNDEVVISSYRGLKICTNRHCEGFLARSNL